MVSPNHKSQQHKVSTYHTSTAHDHNNSNTHRVGGKEEYYYYIRPISQELYKCNYIQTGAACVGCRYVAGVLKQCAIQSVKDAAVTGRQVNRRAQSAAGTGSCREFDSVWDLNVH